MKVRVFPIVGRFLGIGASDEVETPTALVLRRHEYKGRAGSVDYFQLTIQNDAFATLIHQSVVEKDHGEPQEHSAFLDRTTDRT